MVDRNDTPEEDGGFANRFAEAYRLTPSPGPETRERLLRSVRQAKMPRRDGWFVWWVEPAWTLSPLAVSVVAAIAMGLGFGMAWRGTPAPARAPAASSAGAEAERVMEFVLVAPGVTNVALVGDFNGWDPRATPMRRVRSSDTWTVTLSLARGRHVYAFVVDGERWLTDPGAPLAPEDGFGQRSSVIVVGGTGT